MQHVIWRSGAAAGRNQEELKRKRRAGGRQRGLLYTLTHVGHSALKNTSQTHDSIVTPSTYLFKIPDSHRRFTCHTQTHTLLCSDGRVKSRQVGAMPFSSPQSGKQTTQVTGGNRDLTQLFQTKACFLSAKTPSLLWMS